MTERLLFVCSNLDHALQFEDLLRRQAKAGEVYVVTDRHSSMAATTRFVEIGRKLRRLSLIPRPAPASPRHHILGSALRATLDIWRLNDAIADRRTIDMLYARYQPAALPILAHRWRQMPALKSHLHRIVSAVERSIPVDRALVDLIASIDPDIMLLSPVAGLGDSLAEFVRVARRLHIPTVGLAGAWDEFIARGPILEAPDSIAVWNAGQRRQLAHEHHFPPQSVAVVGDPSLRAHIADASLTRDAFAAAHGLDPRSPIVLFAAADTGSARTAIKRFDSWLRALRSHVHRQVSVVVYPGDGHEQAWRELLQHDEGVALLATRVVDALQHSALLATSSMRGVLEAATVGCRVLVHADERVPDPEVVLFHDRIARDQGWMERSDDVEQHCSAISAAIDSPVSRDAVVAARNLVAPHGLEIAPSLLIGLRIIPVVTAESPEPARPRRNVAARLTAAAASLSMSRPARPPTGGLARVLVAAPSLAEIESHEHVLQALVSAGWRVGVVFTPSPRRPLTTMPAIDVAGVEAVGIAHQRTGVWAPIARLTRGLGSYVRASHVTPPRTHALWRDRYAQLSMLGSFAPLCRSGRGQRVMDALFPLATSVERALPIASAARALLAQERPDLLLVLSAPDAVTAAETAPAQIDLIAAAKRRGIATVACIGGADVPLNPGLLHAAPDVAVVWNERQRGAVLRQDVRRCVAVVGAAAFDTNLTDPADASLGHHDFIERLNLSRRRPYLLFAGSTGLIMPVAEEVLFAQRFISLLRRGKDRELRRAIVLIRPAPGHAQPWADADFSGLDDVIVCPTEYESSGALDHALLSEAIRYSGVVVSSHAVALTLATALQRPAIGFTPRGRAIDSLAGAAVKWVHTPADVYSAVKSTIGHTVDAAACEQFVRQHLRPNGAVSAASQHLPAVLDDAIRHGRARRERPSAIAVLSRPVLLGASAIVVGVEGAGAAFSRMRSWLSERRRAKNRPVDKITTTPDVDFSGPRGGTVRAG